LVACICSLVEVVGRVLDGALYGALDATLIGAMGGAVSRAYGAVD